MADEQTIAEPTEAREIFPEGTQRITPCNWNECLNGHRWPVTMAVVQCKGCGASTIAMKMEQCPYCNEPIRKESVRMDLIPRGGSLNSRCRNEPLMGPSIDVELTCDHWEKGQAEAKTFEEKKTIERTTAGK